jgi:hypothetical protein
MKNGKVKKSFKIYQNWLPRTHFRDRGATAALCKKAPESSLFVPRISCLDILAKPILS